VTQFSVLQRLLSEVLSQVSQVKSEMVGGIKIGCLSKVDIMGGINIGCLTASCKVRKSKVRSAYLSNRDHMHCTLHYIVALSRGTQVWFVSLRERRRRNHYYQSRQLSIRIYRTQMLAKIQSLHMQLTKRSKNKLFKVQVEKQRFTTELMMKTTCTDEINVLSNSDRYSVWSNLWVAFLT